ncbi:hypothetical protein RJ639_011919 [Escallonia herrerae]|uniref:Small auxin up regulated protein n=1 Tax=Escallonia herrerae TaxID=1293975 RepID=A0AA88VSL3_9ASTE|nr:hypothetical protein RJ639_011919 [Escallonia herrerae]
MSEEEFGLPGDGHITLPCDAFLMENIISLIQRGVPEPLEKALLTSIFGSRYTSSSYPFPFPCHLDKFLGIDHDVSVSELGKSEENDQQQDSFKDGKEVAEFDCHQEEDNLIAKTH